jgi:hypothetical protein
MLWRIILTRTWRRRDAAHGPSRVLRDQSGKIHSASAGKAVRALFMIMARKV